MIFDISIQIVNFKTKKYLLKCLEDIFTDLAGCNISYKINILDNASGDNLQDLEEKYKNNRNVSFYYSEKNLGFGAGHNLLSKKCQSKYILIFNPDIEFSEKNIIERLLKKAEIEKVKVVGPKLIGLDGKVQRWDHGELEGFVAWIANNSGNAFWKNRNEEIYVAWVSGAVFLVEREIFEKIGGFDENFFLYKEEEDLCISIRKFGGKILYCPEITVVHHNSVVADKNKFMPKSRKYYIDKHYSNKINYILANFLEKILCLKN